MRLEEYLEKLLVSSQTSKDGRVATIEELLFVYLHNTNPAVSPLVELVDDEPLEPTAYKNLITALDSFFARASRENADVGGTAESLFEIITCASRSFSLFA